jgi:hypothetical protein
MLARCARCQGTFQAERYGVQVCPHCGAQVLLADPSAQGGAPTTSPPPAPAPPEPPAGSPPPAAPPGSPSFGAPPSWGPPTGGGLPPPPPPPPGGYGPPPGAFGGPPFGGAGPSGPELPSPFADRAKLGFFRAYYETWKLAAVEPGTFFRRVRIDQPGAAVFFGVISFTVGIVVQTFWTSVTAASVRAQMQEFGERFLKGHEELLSKLTATVNEATSTGALVREAILAPLSGLVLLFVASAILHALLLLVGGARRGFNATLTVAGYAMGLSLLQVIPQCGFPVAAIWAAVVAIVGLSEAHRVGVGRSATAVLLPIVLSCLCLCALAFMAASALGLGAVTGQLPAGVGL